MTKHFFSSRKALCFAQSQGREYYIVASQNLWTVHFV